MKGNRLKGKAAIVTGGAGGIGAAVAELFRAQGAQVLVVDLAGGKDVFKGDVSKEATADAAVARALKAFGRLDVLVNNAAVRDLAPISEGRARNWSKVLDVNVLGALNFMRAAIPALRRSKGCIVNVSSAYALRVMARIAALDAS
jgi:2-hydroxycyclohexanecarboxyl-CoA dehydrogenase